MSNFLGLFNWERARRCGLCNMLGHNIRSCPIRSLPVREEFVNFYQSENQLSIETVPEPSCIADPSNQKECPICLCEFKETNIFAPKCGHKICGDCFFKNIKYNKKFGRLCSLCRQVIVPSNLL